MINLKLMKVFALVILVFLLSIWGLPSYHSQSEFLQENKQTEQKDQEKAEEESEDDWMTKRMKEGDTLYDVLGITDALPTTFDLFLIWLLPVFVLVSIIFLVVILSRRRHQRAMAMIEKGIISEVEKQKYLPKPFNWRLITALIGLVLVLGGIGLSLFMIGEEGIEKWHLGTIPLFVGIAFLIFNQFYYKKRE